MFTATATDEKLKKPVELIVMKPLPGQPISTTARLIYTALLSNAQRQMKDNDGALLSTEYYVVSLPQISIQTGIPMNSATLVKNYIKEMENWKVSWESPNKSGSVLKEDETLLEIFRMLQSPKLIRKSSGTLQLKYTLPPEVNRLLLLQLKSDQPRQFAELNLRLLGQMSRYEALALYEICAKFKNIEHTPKKSVDWWQDALSSKGRSEDEKRREWRKFKSERITKAIQEINELTDINVNLVEERDGREVVSVYFEVEQQKLKDIQIQSDFNVGLVTRAEALGIKEKQAIQLLKRYSDQMFTVGLDKLANRVGNTTAPKLNSHYAFLKICLENAASQNTPQTTDQSAFKENDPPVNSEAWQSPKQSVDFATDEMKKETQINNELRDELKASGMIKEYLLKARAEFLEKGMPLSHTENERVDEGVLTHGRVAGVAVKIWIKEGKPSTQKGQFTPMIESIGDVVGNV